MHAYSSLRVSPNGHCCDRHPQLALQSLCSSEIRWVGRQFRSLSANIQWSWSWLEEIGIRMDDDRIDHQLNRHCSKFQFLFLVWPKSWTPNWIIRGGVLKWVSPPTIVQKQTKILQHVNGQSHETFWNREIWLTSIGNTVDIFQSTKNSFSQILKSQPAKRIHPHLS